MNQKKVAIVSSLSEKIRQTKSVVLADYRGLTHKQAEELHRAVKKAGGEFIVVKNTLLKIAARAAGHDQLAKNEIKGPIAAVFAFEDEFAPLKELAKFIKNVSLPVVRLSYINNTEYDADRTMAIAKLPDLQTLRAQFVYSLTANMQKLVYILSQLKTKI